MIHQHLAAVPPHPCFYHWQHFFEITLTIYFFVIFKESVSVKISPVIIYFVLYDILVCVFVCVCVHAWVCVRVHAWVCVRVHVCVNVNIIVWRSIYWQLPWLSYHCRQCTCACSNGVTI